MSVKKFFDEAKKSGIGVVLNMDEISGESHELIQKIKNTFDFPILYLDKEVEDEINTIEEKPLKKDEQKPILRLTLSADFSYIPEVDDLKALFNEYDVIIDTVENCGFQRYLFKIRAVRIVERPTDGSPVTFSLDCVTNVDVKSLRKLSEWIDMTECNVIESIFIHHNSGFRMPNTYKFKVEEISFTFSDFSTMFNPRVSNLNYRLDVWQTLGCRITEDFIPWEGQTPTKLITVVYEAFENEDITMDTERVAIILTKRTPSFMTIDVGVYNAITMLFENGVSFPLKITEDGSSYYAKCKDLYDVIDGVTGRIFEDRNIRHICEAKGSERSKIIYARYCADVIEVMKGVCVHE